jgi:putative Holliday junction resolvase
MRTLGLDIGDRRIGMALSDPEGILASPLTIIERTNDEIDVKSLADIASRENVDKIIAGLPRSLSGSEGEQAVKVRDFASKLASAVQVPVEFRDERLSTVTAERFMREARTKKPSRGQKPVRSDAVAAAIILQGYLDEVRDRIHQDE